MGSIYNLLATFFIQYNPHIHSTSLCLFESQYHSAGESLLLVPSAKAIWLSGTRKAFSVAALQQWNSLPQEAPCSIFASVL